MAEIAIQLQRRLDDANDPSKLVVVHLNVGPDFGLDMLPYPTALKSCVTRLAMGILLDRGLAPTRLDSGLHLADLRVAGQPLPDLDVVVSLAPARLGVDGFLGLDFFEQFDVVEWRPKARRLRLIVD